MPKLTAACVLLLVLALAGCNIGQPRNPTFSLTTGEARDSLREMSRRPKALERPVVIVGGWGRGDLATTSLYEPLMRAIRGADVTVVTFQGLKNFEQCRARLVETVAEVYGTDEQGYTAEVDVIGISMGGLVARDAAAAPREGNADPRRLRIGTMYGIGVPHNGIRAANLAVWDEYVNQMRGGSRLHQRLDAAWEAEPGTYEIVDYVRLGDPWVGPRNAQFPGTTVRWVHNTATEDAHHGFHDPRIIADIARRLRGEPPHSTDPPAPLP